MVATRPVARRYGSPSCSRPASISSRHVSSTTCAVAGHGGGAGRRGRGRGAVAVPAAELGQLGARACSTVRKPSPRRRPSPRRCRRARGCRAARCRRVSTARTAAGGPPSRRTCRPSRPPVPPAARRRRIGSRRSPGPRRLTTNARSRAPCGRAGVGQVDRRRRRRRVPPSLPRVAASMISSLSRPARAGSESTPQAAATSARASASATGRPPGSRHGQAAGVDRAPVAGAARHPGHPTPVRWASRSAALNAPGEVASRSPTRSTPPASSATAPSSATASRAAASSPGAVLAMSSPSILASPRVACAAHREDLGRASDALRSRRKIVAASSSGSSPTSTTVRAASRSQYVTPRARAGHVGGEEVGLLGGVRAGAEVDVVGAEHGPGELGVREGVLGGEPSAGEHADAGAARRPAPRAAASERRRPRGGLQLAGRSSRTSGVGQPVVQAWCR